MRAACAARCDEAGGGERFIADTYAIFVSLLLRGQCQGAKQPVVPGSTRASCMDVFVDAALIIVNQGHPRKGQGQPDSAKKKG